MRYKVTYVPNSSKSKVSQGCLLVFADNIDTARKIAGYFFTERVTILSIDLIPVQKVAKRKTLRDLIREK